MGVFDYKLCTSSLSPFALGTTSKGAKLISALNRQMGIDRSIIKLPQDTHKGPAVINYARTLETLH